MSPKFIPTVAIVGRTNVGKSTLFNALAKRRLAVVEDIPGVTRDRTSALIRHYAFPFTLIDTGGLVGEEENEFRGSVRSQAELAISESDIVLALFDGVHGLHPLDAEVVQTLRRAGKPVLWVVNKCEGGDAHLTANELYALGLDEVLCISAIHRQGFQELLLGIAEELDLDLSEEDAEDSPEKAEEEKPRRIAIIGRPNVGKSTLINKLVGSERVITSDTPGTTRDTVVIPLRREGVNYEIFDTAGLRKKARVADMSVERFSNVRTLRALAMADVALLLLDASTGLPTDQDASLAGLAHERGRPLILVVNKWDAIEKDHKTVKEYEVAIRETLPFVSYAPLIFISAKTGRRCPSVFTKAVEVYESAGQRIKTADLNRALSDAFEKNPPPVFRGQPIKLFFATQVDVRPPQIVLFVNFPDKLSASYLRYLKRSLRETYPFIGTDIKFEVKKRRQEKNGG